jgi:CheY-like chemotaxis protein
MRRLGLRRSRRDPGGADGRARLLLVEDDPGDALMVREALEQNGVPVPLARARDGGQALRMLRQAGAPPTRLILLDLGLPGRSGLDILADLQADRVLAAIPVIVLSASRNPADAERSRDLGADSYIVKPDDFDGFLELVREIEAALGLAPSR